NESCQYRLSAMNAQTSTRFRRTPMLLAMMIIATGQVGVSIYLRIYPPGSTVKPFIAVSALQDGIITPNTTRNDPGYWRIPNTDTRPFRDWLRWG
ncbi:penicillin-binding transpeptidase domain-containing protein, partial [Vibrio cholerae]|uniref:penicillin-binding transpeptidase domain-containing protein n=1 Tax=Vibrio cholerae TaxID=666 RepID=UPI003F6517F4